MIRYPSTDEALELHRLLLDHFGGLGGVRDLGLLESALYRPQTGYYKDVMQMAAALMESLMINHPFVDGNKRVAFFLTDAFLRMNGWKIKVRPKEGHRFIVNIIVEESNRLTKLARWLKLHTEVLD
jgi:death-on-curing protein